jgi:hypothetical protein
VSYHAIHPYRLASHRNHSADEDLGQSLDALPAPPDLTALDAIWRGVCLVEPTNSSALAICMGVLGSHVAAVVGSANVAHPCLQRCREVISLMQCHPATTRPMAENLADLLAQCSVGAHPTAWPAVSEREQKSPNVVANPESAPVQNGSSPDRPRLQPARAAPPLPNSTWPAVGERTAPHTPPPPNRSSAGSPGQPRHPVSPLRRRSSSNAPTDRALRVRSWLKTLRLHKYCNILEQMNYEDMVTLSEVDLEKLGITAKGARAKVGGFCVGVCAPVLCSVPPGALPRPHDLFGGDFCPYLPAHGWPPWTGH